MRIIQLGQRSEESYFPIDAPLRTVEVSTLHSLSKVERDGRVDFMCFTYVNGRYVFIIDSIWPDNFIGSWMVPNNSRSAYE